MPSKFLNHTVDKERYVVADVVVMTPPSKHEVLSQHLPRRATYSIGTWPANRTKVEVLLPRIHAASVASSLSWAESLASSCPQTRITMDSLRCSLIHCFKLIGYTNSSADKHILDAGSIMNMNLYCLWTSIRGQPLSQRLISYGRLDCHLRNSVLWPQGVGNYSVQVVRRKAASICSDLTGSQSQDRSKFLSLVGKTIVGR